MMASKTCKKGKRLVKREMRCSGKCWIKNGRGILVTQKITMAIHPEPDMNHLKNRLAMC